MSSKAMNLRALRSDTVAPWPTPHQEIPVSLCLGASLIERLHSALEAMPRKGEPATLKYIVFASCFCSCRKPAKSGGYLELRDCRSHSGKASTSEANVMTPMNLFDRKGQVRCKREARYHC